ncbi:MAG: fibronectin type III domain-containing protein [Candidatus Latescibacteria bacterium]|nr:fibronectin type III domain-containing protein [Candidatus Latescibacterota bacterium]
MAVQAFDQAGNYGPLSLPGQATTRGVLPASGLNATAGIERIELRWNRSLDAVLAGYNLYRANRSDGEYLRLSGSEGTSFTTGRTAYLDSNLEGGQLYYYRVSAVTATEESALSEFAGAVALPDTL